MRISQAFPSKYIKAGDLEDRAHIVTIERVEMTDVGQEGAPEIKPVVYFAGKEKGIVLNRTNADTIAFLYGDETEAWRGKQIEVYPDTTHFQGRVMPCIRMRRPMPPAQPSQPDQRLSTPLPPPNAAPGDPGPSSSGPSGDLNDEIPW